MSKLSVRSPTQSELNTFKVLANLDFADLTKPEPRRNALGAVEEAVVGEEETPDRANDETAVASLWGGQAIRSASEDRRSERDASEARPRENDRRTESSATHEYQRESSTDRPHNFDFGERSYDERREEDLRSQDRHSEVQEDQNRRSEAADADRPARDESEEARYYAKAKASNEADIAIEKEGLLYELELMEKQGLVSLHRRLTMSDSLETIQYQYDRANMLISTQQTVEWAKTGIQVGSNVLEGALKRFGIGLVDGFSKNLCKDMSKFNRPLTKLYRKHWRAGKSSPEWELAMIVFGALAMTIMANKGFSLFGGPAKAAEEPFGRPQPPAMPHGPSGASSTQLAPPSVLRPPMMPAPAQAIPRPVAVQTPAAIPEWAKAAMQGPMGPAPPVHFAQQLPRPTTAPTFPETNIFTPTPVLPVPATVQQQLSRVAERVQERPAAETPKAETPKVEVEQPKDRGGTKTVNLGALASPRSSRRRKQVTEELNLDDDA